MYTNLYSNTIVVLERRNIRSVCVRVMSIRSEWTSIIKIKKAEHMEPSGRQDRSRERLGEREGVPSRRDRVPNK